MRGSEHSHEVRSYEITENGAVVHGQFKDDHDLIRSSPADNRPTRYSGLTGSEAVVLDALTTSEKYRSPRWAYTSGWMAKQLRPALERIVALGYGISKDRDGVNRWYAALTQPAL